MNYLLIGLFLFSGTIWSQSKINGSWDAVRLTYSYNSWLYYFKAQGRFYPVRSQIHAYLARSALSYSVRPWFSLWLGYDYFDFFQGANQKNQRIWSQMQVDLNPTATTNIVIRPRLENIWSEAGNGHAIRLRHRTTVVWPEQISTHVSPTIYNEIFVNLNHPDWVSNKTISQNRIFLGTLIDLPQQQSIQIGYLNRGLFNTHQVVRENILLIQWQYAIES